MKKVRRFAIIYFGFQGIAVVSWWIILQTVPASRTLFRLETDSESSLLAFWLPDLAFIAIGSLVTSVLLHLKSRFEIASIWFVTGAISYATLYVFAFALMTDRGWLGVTLMVPAMLWTGVFATGITSGNAMFRPAREASTSYVLLKTYVQIVVVWTIILVVFPYLITILEDKIGLVRLEFAFQKQIAILVFAGISALGIWAAHSMSHIGKGTPLPLDHAKQLVVVGPYAYVRNPMALSGIIQGLAVALFLGSPLVAVYAVMGSIIWQTVFRPLEEDDLASRFGISYSNYCNAVRCWVPRRNSYQIEGTTDSSNSVDSPLGRM